MSISFNQIPVDIRTPGQYIEFDSSRALQGLPVVRHRILMVGQRTTAGVTPVTNQLRRVESVAQAEELWGAGSLLACMVRAVRSVNQYTELWVVALPDGAGVAATGSITFSGAATETKAQQWHIGGRLVQISIVAGDDASAVATKLRQAITADKRMQVTASGSAGVVTITCNRAGEWGNKLDLRYGYYDAAVGGEVRGLTATVVAMSGGTINPSISGLEAVLGSEWFQTIVMPYTDAANLAILSDLMSRRFGPMLQLEGHAYIGNTGSVGSASTLGDSLNSPHITIMHGGKSPTPPWEWAAQAAAIDAAEPDPARPRQTLALAGVLPPARKETPTLDERNVLLYDGVSTFTVDAGSTVRVERLITTYKTNNFGAEDTSYLDVETLRTIAYLRYTVRNRIATKYPRHKLANDGTLYGPGQAIVTPSVIRAEMLALFREWEYAGLAEGFDQFKRDLIVERSATDPNRVDAVIPPDVVNQFRVFAGQVQFRL